MRSKRGPWATKLAGGAAQELSANIRRRPEEIGQNAAELYEFGPFRLEPSERKLWRNIESVALTPGGFRSADEIAQLPGARRIDEGGLVPGPSSDVYAFYRGTACTAFQFRESLVEARRRGI